jgi:hypothetical protein
MRTLVRALIVFLTPCLLALSAASAQVQTDVDLELLLAVDVSFSMDPDEQRLQRDGYVEAFRDPQIIRAIQSGPHGRIAVTYVEWAGPESQHVIVPWTLIDSPASAEAFAAMLAAQPISRLRMTSISSALIFARSHLRASTFRGTRRVIDVPGDGANNSGPPVTPVRDALIGEGVVINGLPILLRPGSAWRAYDIADLDVYYKRCVIGGPGAFMIPIRQKAEFSTATRQKLLLEISDIMSEARVALAQRPVEDGLDCTIGERLWHREWRR